VHVLPDDRAVEHVQRGEQRRRAVAHVIVGHGSSARQPRLRSVERLDPTFLVEAESNGVRRRIDVEPDDVAQFGDELRVFRKLELPYAVRLEPRGAPDTLNRGGADADGLRHWPAGPA
jgi:hypothetical protein